MTTDNNDFYTLLNSVVNEQKFSLQLSNKHVVECKYLSTAQLKSLIETIVDNPITQVAFTTATTKIFKECLLSTPPDTLNVIDRLMFILEQRIRSISPTATIRDEEETRIVDLTAVLEKLRNLINQDSVFQMKTLQDNNVSIQIGVAWLSTENQLNEEVYSKQSLTIEDEDELKRTLGITFINEIAKTINLIVIKDRVFDLSTVSFAERLKMIESLPASLIQKAIEYLENYKKVIEECLIVDGKMITVDGTLFSVR